MASGKQRYDKIEFKRVVSREDTALHVGYAAILRIVIAFSDVRHNGYLHKRNDRRTACDETLVNVLLQHTVSRIPASVSP